MALNQTEQYVPNTTSPTIVAFSAIKQSVTKMGEIPFKGKKRVIKLIFL
jgi:hypothetical protein